jgi:NAD(P)H dehydrogenase (quinone)
MSGQEGSIRVVVVYYSRFGVLGDLANAVVEGIHSVPEARGELLEVGDQPVEALRMSNGANTSAEGNDEMKARRDKLLEQLTTADALVVGGPAYFGSLASPVKRFFEDVVTASGTILDRTRPWHQPLFRDKVGAAFTASATPHGGNEQTLHSILTMLMHLGLIVVTPGQQGPILEHGAAPYGATAITGPTGAHALTEGEREEARHLGRRVAEVTLWVRDGKDTAMRRSREEATVAGQGYDPSA